MKKLILSLLLVQSLLPMQEAEKKAELAKKYNQAIKQKFTVTDQFLDLIKYKYDQAKYKEAQPDIQRWINAGWITQPNTKYPHSYNLQVNVDTIRNSLQKSLYDYEDATQEALERSKILTKELKKVDAFNTFLVKHNVLQFQPNELGQDTLTAFTKVCTEFKDAAQTIFQKSRREIIYQKLIKQRADNIAISNGLYSVSELSALISGSTALGHLMRCGLEFATWKNRAKFTYDLIQILNPECNISLAMVESAYKPSVSVKTAIATAAATISIGGLVYTVLQLSKRHHDHKIECTSSLLKLHENVHRHIAQHAQEQLNELSSQLFPSTNINTNPILKLYAHVPKALALPKPRSLMPYVQAKISNSNTAQSRS